MVEVALWMLSFMDNQDSYFLNLTLDGYIRDNNTLCGIAIRNFLFPLFKSVRQA